MIYQYLLVGLKDFEEWLLYVEKSPENLYVLLKYSPHTAFL